MLDKWPTGELFNSLLARCSQQCIGIEPNLRHPLDLPTCRVCVPPERMHVAPGCRALHPKGNPNDINSVGELRASQWQAKTGEFLDASRVGIINPEKELSLVCVCSEKLACVVNCLSFDGGVNG